MKEFIHHHWHVIRLLFWGLVAGFILQEVAYRIAKMRLEKRQRIATNAIKELGASLGGNKEEIDRLGTKLEQQQAAIEAMLVIVKRAQYDQFRWEYACENYLHGDEIADCTKAADEKEAKSHAV